MKDYSFYNRALKLDEKNAGKYYAQRAVLYFYDMEYDLAWEDFKKAEELGVNVKENIYYEILQFSKTDFDTEIGPEFSENIGYHALSKYIGAFLVQKRFSDACVFMGKLLGKQPHFSLFQAKMQNLVFEMKRQRFKKFIEKTPRYESVYFWRIQLFIDNCDIFSKEKKKFFRQRINQDFDTLERISRNPEYICLFRSRYYENMNEIRYAIKFCQRALDIAKSKNNEGLTYIISCVLKNLYIKNYAYDKALEIAMTLVDTKPVPQILSREVNRFHYIPSVFHYKFPPEFEKYKSYKFIKKCAIERRKKQKTN